MLDGLLAILTGGATGVLGTLISFGTNYLERKQKHAQELELRDRDIDLAKIESAGLERVAQIEAESREDQAAWRGFEESFREARARWSRPGDGFMMLFVDFCRGMTRPGLTWLFVCLVGGIYFTVADGETETKVIDTILYLATTCVTWWFGARNIGKAPK